MPKRGPYKKAEKELIARECSERTRGIGFNLKEFRFRLDIGKKFFYLGMVRHWNRLSRRVVDAPSLEVLEVRLNGALSNLVSWELSLPMAGGWNKMIFVVPLNPDHSMKTLFPIFCLFDGS